MDPQELNSSALSIHVCITLFFFFSLKLLKDGRKRLIIIMTFILNLFLFEVPTDSKEKLKQQENIHCE